MPVFGCCCLQLLSRVRLFATPGLQPASLPRPSPSPGACSNSRPRWCHPTVSSSSTVHVCMIGNYPNDTRKEMYLFHFRGPDKVEKGSSCESQGLSVWGRCRCLNENQTDTNFTEEASPELTVWLPLITRGPGPVPPASLCLLTDDAVIG